LRRPDGSILWDGIILDISDRKGAQAEAAAASSRLLGAVEAMSEAVAVFDAEDRLVICNARYREINAVIADRLVARTTFEELLRAAVPCGRFRDAIGNEEAWIAARLERHRAATGSFEQQLAEDRWLQVMEQRTPDGGILILATDITEVKRRQEAMTLLAGGA